MFTIVLVFALAFWCVPHLVTAQEANITIPPRAVNVSVNEVAEFTCTAVASAIIWRANGQQIDEGDVVKITTVLVNGTLSIRKSTLELTVSSTDDATNITCTAITESSTSPESDPVLLLVQGLLDSVNDLAVEPINSTTIKISWSPPFTLDQVPILGYTVTITNVTSGENEVLEMENTTTTNYVFAIDDPDPGDNFTVTVIPINVVGAGQVSVDFKFSVKEVVVSSTESAPSITPTPVTSITTSDNFVGTMMPTIEGINPTSNPIVIGVIIAGVLVILLIAVVLISSLIVSIIIKRRKKSTTSEQDSTETTDHPAVKNQMYEQNKVQTDSAVESNGALIQPAGSSPPVYHSLYLTTTGSKKSSTGVYLCVWEEDIHNNQKRLLKTVHGHTIEDAFAAFIGNRKSSKNLDEEGKPLLLHEEQDDEKDGNASPTPR